MYSLINDYKSNISKSKVKNTSKQKKRIVNIQYKMYIT
jgi:hypothetical protein